MKRSASSDRYINLLYYLAMAALVAWYAYTKGWIFADFPSVEPKVALQMIANDDNLTVIDVRTPEEFRQGHLEGALSVPLDTIKTRLAQLPKSKRILLYCRSGHRSIAAARQLRQAGFEVINVKSGLLGLYHASAKLTR